jgi:hypothetical protein
MYMCGGYRRQCYRGGIVPPRSFPAFFVSTATTHRAKTTSLPGGCGPTINSAWRRLSETSDPDDDDAPPDLTGDYLQSPLQILRIPT